MRSVVCICSAMVFAAGCADGTSNTAHTVVLPDTVTFTEHIAPIIHTSCAPCHRPGEAGPFSLITYDDVRRKAKTIKKVTGAGYMPPWPADTAYSHFLNERVLSAKEVALIARWVDQGALRGNGEAPTWHNLTTALGAPDAVVWLQDRFPINGDARDRFIISKAGWALERDTFLRAIEFVPGNRRAVHHMNGALINYAEGAKADPFEASVYIDAEQFSGVDAFTALKLQNDDGSWPALVPSAINYLPGMSPAVYPPGIGGLRISKRGAFLLNTLHYGPSARDTSDRSRFHLYFSPTPPLRPQRELSMGSTHTEIVPPLHLEPGEEKTFRTSLKLTEDISVLSINPHMHLLGTRFLAYAVTPVKDTIPLIRINDWDFRWQYTYTFPHMMPLQRGTVVHVEGTFDNSANNPQQPFDPPRAVTGTDSKLMKTTDEMMQFFITYVDHRPGDDTISLAPVVPVQPLRAAPGASATTR